MLKFTRLLQHQAKGIYLLFLLIALAGAAAFTVLPSAVYPELTFARITVIGGLGDLSAEQVVLSATRLLEAEVGQVPGVDWVKSKTIRGSTEISVNFQPGTNMDQALQQVQARVTQIQSALPAGITLDIERITPAIFPVLSYNLSSSTLLPTDLDAIARYQIQPRLTRVPGVSRIQIQGGNAAEVEVQVDPVKLKNYSLSLPEVSNALQQSSQTLAVGKLDRLDQQNLLIANGQPTDPQALLNVVITSRGDGKPLFLRDVATVTLGEADPTQIVSVHGRPGLTLNVFRQPYSNVVAVGQGVAREWERLRPSLPPGLEIEPAYDESGLVVDAIANVRDSILIGIALIIVVLYAFLREWRSTFIAALTIPLSALAAFCVLYLVGESLNLMSLGGLAVAIGLVIDDAIVVIENIDRQLQHQADPQRAVAAAMGELAGPVISSTATTVAVFLPLGLLSGVAGEFFISLTITLAAAVIFSLLLALVLTPLLAARVLQGGTSHSEPRMLVRLDQGYTDLLGWALDHPRWLVAMAVGLLGLGITLFQGLGNDFLPAFDEGSYIVDYVAPAGTSLQQTSALAERIEQVLAKTPEVVTWTRRTGAQNGLFATEPNTGDIQVILQPQSQRHRSVFAVIDQQRQDIAALVPQLQVNFHQILQDELDDLSGSASPIALRLFGSDSQQLGTLSDQIAQRIKAVPGLVDLAQVGSVAVPELDLVVDPVAAGQLGLTQADVALQVQNALFGQVIGQLRQGERLVDIRVRLPAGARQDRQQILQIPIAGSNHALVPLGEIAQVVDRDSQAEILRENQQRYVGLNADLQGQDLGSVVSSLRRRLQPLNLPAGYSLDIGGLYQSQQQAFWQLLQVLALALLLVYLILLLQFRSFRQPLVIFTTVPLALLGVVVALRLTQIPLNVSSLMGIVLLVGLVVKNGIILLEYTNQLRAQEYPLREALLRAGRARLRPILMTTLCTILGLLPLALGLGAGSELQKPLAVSVIGGLCVSTLFTLLFVPVVFSLAVGKPAGARQLPVDSPVP